MQKTGTIINIQPDGGYQGQDGYINTFQMTIRCQDGEFTGQIGSKSQNYPIATGQQISVEVTNNVHGVRFKKFNPQYAQGGQQNTQQGSQRSPQGQKSQPDWDAIATGKVRHGLVCAAVQSLQIKIETETDCEKWLQYVMHGRKAPPQQQSNANPDYVGDNPPPPVDEIIPF